MAAILKNRPRPLGIPAVGIYLVDGDERPSIVSLATSDGDAESLAAWIELHPPLQELLGVAVSLTEATMEAAIPGSVLVP